MPYENEPVSSATTQPRLERRASARALSLPTSSGAPAETLAGQTFRNSPTTTSTTYAAGGNWSIRGAGSAAWSAGKKIINNPITRAFNKYVINRAKFISDFPSMLSTISRNSAESMDGIRKNAGGLGRVWFALGYPIWKTASLLGASIGVVTRNAGSRLWYGEAHSELGKNK